MKNKLSIGVVAISLISMGSWAARKPQKPEISMALSPDIQLALSACRDQPSPLPRLQCYDQAWHPEIRAMSKDKADETWRQIMAQEQQRTSDDPPLMLRELKNTSGQPVLMITTPSLEHSFTRAILAVSCVENITRMQIVFYQPQGSGESALTLRTDRNDINSRWFWRSSGYRLESSRGLSGIAEIQQLIGGATLTILTGKETLNGLSFRLNNLQTTLQPLRKACHW
ncbi:type VI secretion system-associated protein VasI [Hafnia paralvei]|uniref:type VI secretion system-associated protein VasI n=1 Tax=Hafnia paralvei TaxID=546367 RepID=UPI0026DBD569|nr:type VI secretion system-associated protein VasI [Hafnia paralvei]MDX6910851.1 type VI secretion system-associated protein VasI [Hafnia paralvei]